VTTATTTTTATTHRPKCATRGRAPNKEFDLLRDKNDKILTNLVAPHYRGGEARRAIMFV
jgi:hypothetical protein